MTAKPLDDALDTEQLVAIDPPLERRVEAGPRRANLVPGRSLSHHALTREQRAREAHCSRLGRALGPGVVSGLAVGLEADGVHLRVEAGRGLTAAGEDVKVGRDLRVALGTLPVLGVASLVPDDSTPRRGIRGVPTWDQLRDDTPAELPVAGFLVVRPVRAERLPPAADHPCDRDPEAEAFEDQQQVDGAALFLQGWPSDLDLPLPSRGSRWRNRMAHGLFEYERVFGTRHDVPWLRFGLPIAVVGFADEATIEFIDGPAVRRAATAGLGRRASLAGTRTAGPRTAGWDPGPPALQYARIEQLGAHVAELEEAAGASVAKIAGAFRHLPPVGVIPSGVVDLARRRTSFFPETYYSEVAPLSLDDLPLAVRESASLAPYDLAEPDAVRILAPVPDSVYDARLLVEEAVDPIFDRQIAVHTKARGRNRSLRDDSHAQWATLRQVLDGGEAPAQADPDTPPDEAPDPTTDLGDPIPELARSSKGFSVPEVDALEKELRKEFARDLAEDAKKRSRIDREGLPAFIVHLKRVSRNVKRAAEFGYLRIDTDILRVRQQVRGAAGLSLLAASPITHGLLASDRGLLEREEFADFLADDAVVEGEVPQDRVRTTEATLGRTRRRREELERRTFSEAGPGISTRRGDAIEGIARRDPQRLGDRQRIDERGGRIEPSSGSTLGAEPLRSKDLFESYQEPPALGAKGSASATQFEILKSLKTSGADLAKIEIPLRILVNGKLTRTNQAFDKVDPDALPADPAPGERTEGRYFADTVEILEHTLVAIHHAWDRLNEYLDAIARCERALASIRNAEARARTRGDAAQRELDESRHDVGVARALQAEEEARIEAIHARRKRIIAEHVRFLVYVRPRRAGSDSTMPMRTLDPAPAQDTVPACLAHDADPSDALLALMEVVRESPVSWFPRVAKRPRVFTKWKTLSNLVLVAKAREQVFAKAPVESFSKVAASAELLSGKAGLGSILHEGLVLRRDRAVRRRRAVQQLEIPQLRRLGLLHGWREVAKVVTLGDWIEAAGGNPLAGRAARELEDLTRAATCLYAAFSEVPAALRLVWTERLSQFDASFDFDHIWRLRGWGQLEVELRREIETLVEWVDGRFARDEPDAQELGNEIVRSALLLASHAPISRIVAAHAAEDTPVSPGGVIDLVVDLDRVRLGMDVYLPSKGGPVRARIEDMLENAVRARVVEAPAHGAHIAAGARVEIVAGAGRARSTRWGKR